jgi:hypothetical protein
LCYTIHSNSQHLCSLVELSAKVNKKNMSKEKSLKEKSGKKAPEKNLKEKRAAKAAKRDGKNNDGAISFGSGTGSKHAG